MSAELTMKAQVQFLEQLFNTPDKWKTGKKKGIRQIILVPWGDDGIRSFKMQTPKSEVLKVMDFRPNKQDISLKCSFRSARSTF